MKKRVYNRIKAVLAEKGKTNKWLATELEVHDITVSSWCSNSKQPEIATLFRIAELLDIEAKDLLVSRK